MPLPKLRKPPPLKIAESPWWLTRRFIIWAIVFASLAFRAILDISARGLGRLLINLEALALALVIYACGYAIYKLFFASFIEDPPLPPDEKLPSPICPHCGYDVRATLLRCPECGHDTPFKLWLDKNPLERAIFENPPTVRMRDKPREAIPSSNLSETLPKDSKPPTNSPQMPA